MKFRLMKFSFKFRIQLFKLINLRCKVGEKAQVAHLIRKQTSNLQTKTEILSRLRDHRANQIMLENCKTITPNHTIIKGKGLRIKMHHLRIIASAKV